jgi:GAF domain-containing protein/HAMP domain-containing protein
MSPNSLQGLTLALSVVGLVLAIVVLWLDWRKASNITLSIFLTGFSLYGLGIAGLASSTTAEQAAPWAMLATVVMFQVPSGLLLFYVRIFRPTWLQRKPFALTLALVIAAPVVLALIDVFFQTKLVYSGIDPRSYSVGSIDLTLFQSTFLSALFRVTHLAIIQALTLVFLIFVRIRSQRRSLNEALLVLIIIQVLSTLSQTVAHAFVGALASTVVLQLLLTTGVTLAVFQTGLLSTHNLTRRLGWSGLSADDDDQTHFTLEKHSISVSAKVLALVAVTLLTIIGLQTWLNIGGAEQQNSAAEQERLTHLYNSYRTTVSDQERSMASLSTSLADRADVKALLKTRDREGLVQLLTPVFGTLKEQYGIAHLYLEDSNGIVFVRIDEPDHYGDDVTYRRTAAEALTSHQTTAGLEIGPNRLGVRSVSPMLDQGELIGLLEVGLDYDQSFINVLRSRTGGDYRLWVAYDAAAPAGLKPAADAPSAPTDQIFFYISTSQNIPEPAPAAYERAMATNRAEYQVVGGDSEQWLTLIAPIQVYPDRTIGAIEISISRVAALTTLRQNQINALAISIGLALLAFALLWVSTDLTVLRPLRHLATVAGRQLSGDLAAEAHLETRDEFSQLGQTFNSLTAQLRDSIGLLEQRVEARTSQLQASAEVGRAAASILDADELLHTIVNLIADRFGFYYVAVFTLDDSHQWAELREATGEAGRILKERQHRLVMGSQSMVSAAIQTRRARIALDTGEEVVRFANPLLPETRSEIALPLIVGDRVLGALDVQSTQAAAFDETNAAVLQAMADQIAIALSNATQFKETAATLQTTRNLFAASQEISAATDLDDLLNTLIGHITPDASRAAIALFGPRDETGQPAYFEFASTWVHADFAAMTQAIRPGARFTTQQLPGISSVTAAQPLVVPDVSADEVPPALRTLMHRFGAEAMVALALTASQNPLGILIVGYRQARLFNTDYIETLVTLSSQAAIVIQNRRSLAETQTTLQQLDLLNRRLTGEAWRAYTDPLGGALTVQDTAPSLSPEASTAGIDVPIVVRGESIGALKLQDADPDRAWSETDRTLLAAVANEVAIAIDNARLLEQTERRAQREQFIAEISRKMLAAHDMHGIIQVAGDELGRVLHVSRTAIKLGLEESEPNGQSQPEHEPSARS